MNDIQEHLRLYSELSDKITKYNDALTRLKEKRDRITKELETRLTRSGGISQPIKTKDGQFRFRKIKVYSSITKGYLSATLGNILGDPKRADIIVTRLYKGRTVSEKMVLSKVH